MEDSTQHAGLGHGMAVLVLAICFSITALILSIQVSKQSVQIRELNNRISKIEEVVDLGEITK